jgi:hypothetical protein
MPGGAPLTKGGSQGGGRAVAQGVARHLMGGGARIGEEAADKAAFDVATICAC